MGRGKLGWDVGEGGEGKVGMGWVGREERGKLGWGG